MGVFQPVRETHDSLDTRVVAYIRSLVESGALKPGDRLPAERDLAVQLGVSRTALREALHTLAALGLVELRQGRGVFITANSARATAERLLETFRSQDGAARVHDLFEIRRVLEGAAAEWAAQRASQDQIAELGHVVADARAAATAEPVDYTHAAELDARFHALIAASAANHTLTLLMSTLLEELAAARSQSLMIPGRVARSIDQHEQIVAALAASDPAAARARMLEHLDDVELAILQERLAPAP